MAPRKKIIAYTQAGLMNKLSCLLVAMEIAAQQDRELLVYWDDNDPGVNVKFNDLFDKPLTFVSSEEIKKLEDVALYTHKRSVEAAAGPQFKDDSLLVLKNKYGISENLKDIEKSTAQNIVFHYWSIDPSVPYAGATGSNFLNRFPSLLIKEDILKEVLDFMQQNDINEEVIGMHIRATDFNDVFDESLPWAKYAEFTEGVAQEGKRIFLISDSREVEETFSKKYDCIIVRTDKQYPRKIDESKKWIVGDPRTATRNYYADKEIIRDGLIDFCIAMHTTFLGVDLRSVYGYLLLGLSRREQYLREEGHPLDAGPALLGRIRENE